MESGNLTEDKDIQEGKLFAAIGYVGILCIFPLLLKKDNKFALFHGKQGLVLFLGEVILSFIGIIPILGWIVGALLFLVFVILSILGILEALMGRYWQMPIVAELAKKISL